MVSVIGMSGSAPGTHTKKALVARDRVGKKNRYSMQDDSKASSFGPERKLCLRDGMPATDEKRSATIFPAVHSAPKDIYRARRQSQLPYMGSPRATFDEVCYGDFLRPKGNPHEEEWSERFRQTIVRSNPRPLDERCALGAFFSGGIDSPRCRHHEPLMSGPPPPARRIRRKRIK